MAFTAGGSPDDHMMIYSGSDDDGVLDFGFPEECMNDLLPATPPSMRDEPAEEFVEFERAEESLLHLPASAPASAPPPGLAEEPAETPKYLTPQEIYKMQCGSEDAFHELIQDAEKEVSGGSLLSTLKVPIFDAPPTQPQEVPGYPGGMFDPEKRGASYFVCTDGGARVFKTNNMGANWYFSPLAQRHMTQLGESGYYKLGCVVKDKATTDPKTEFEDRCVPYQFFRLDRSMSASEETLTDEQKELRMWLEEKLPTFKSGLNVAQLSAEWETDHPEEKFPSLASLGGSNKKKIIVVLRSPTFANIVRVEEVDKIYVLRPADPDGKEKTKKSLYLVTNMKSKRGPKQAKDAGSASQEARSPPPAAAGSVVPRKVVAAKKRKTEDVLETGPGKITAPSALHLCEMLNLEPTEEKLSEIKLSYGAWYKSLAMLYKVKEHEYKGDWPDYIWRYCNENAEPLEGEDAEEAKKRHHVFVTHMFREYVSHAKTHDKLLGARSAEEIEKCGINFEVDLRNLYKNVEVHLQVLAVHGEQIAELFGKNKTTEPLSTDELSSILQKWGKHPGFAACLAYSKLEITRGWTLGFRKKWWKADQANWNETEGLAWKLFDAFGEKKENQHFQKKIRMDIRKICESDPDWRTKVETMRVEALKLAREEKSGKTAGGYFTALCKEDYEFAPYRQAIEKSERENVGSVKEPRAYQLELIEKSLRANTVVFAPTGTGKTKVACERIGRLLEGKPEGKAVMVVKTIPLMQQQIEAVRADLPGVKVRGFCGAKPARGFNSFEDLLNGQAVMVVVPAYLLILLKDLSGSLDQIDLLVMDECHHCSGGDAYAEVLKLYRALPVDRPRPAVLGLTASLPSADSVDDAQHKIQDLLHRMGGARLASVVENIDELEKYQNKVQDKEEWVQMADEEHWLEDLIQTLRSKVASAPDIQDALRDAIQSKLDEAESISADCGVRQALGALAQMLLALMNAAGSEEESVWIVEHLIVGRPGLKLFEPIKAEKGPPTSSPGPEPSPGGGSPGASKGGKPLGEERPALGVDGPAAEQPQQAEERFDYDEHGLIRARKSERLEKLHDILTKIQRNFEDGPTDQVGTFRGIVFVKSRQSACEILDWIKNHAGLNAFFKPSPFVGQVCMTIQDQYDATVRFHSGECNLLVATSVAEEGLDFPACNIVVRYSSASSHTALIQSRGRVRAGQGEMYILTRRPDSRESVSFRKSQRFEKFAKEAAAKLSVQ